MRRRAQEGFTLIEVLVASTLAVAVAIAIGTMGGGHSKLEEEVIARSGLASDQGAVALATVQMAERIARADWVVLNNGTGTFQFRIPLGCSTPACLDIATNYRWDQYKLSGGVLQLYTGTGAGCGTVRTIASRVTGLTFTQSTNELTYVLTWDNGLAAPRNRTHDFRGRVISRALGSPGTELAPLPAPPATC